MAPSHVAVKLPTAGAQFEGPQQAAVVAAELLFSARHRFDGQCGLASVEADCRGSSVGLMGASEQVRPATVSQRLRTPETCTCDCALTFEGSAASWRR